MHVLSVGWVAGLVGGWSGYDKNNVTTWLHLEDRTFKRIQDGAECGNIWPFLNRFILPWMTPLTQILYEEICPCCKEYLWSYRWYDCQQHAHLFCLLGEHALKNINKLGLVEQKKQQSWKLPAPLHSSNVQVIFVFKTILIFSSTSSSVVKWLSGGYLKWSNISTS